VHHFTCFKAQTHKKGGAVVISILTMGARRGLRRGQAAVAAAFSACPFLALAVLLALPELAAGDTHYYTFNVKLL
jgi:threonine/homoserine/homoserine lactone efflux protein